MKKREFLNLLRKLPSFIFLVLFITALELVLGDPMEEAELMMLIDNEKEGC